MYMSEEELVRVKGIGPVIALKLYKAGIKTVEELATAKPEDLAWIKGFGTASATRVIKNAQDLLNIEKGLQNVLDAIRDTFVRACPKCGGDMESKYVILGPQKRMGVYQCKLCKFYLPR